ncbi:carbohydrate ABC transporter permease [Kribbella pratensis]|uniref:Carbohydrate ABC transporter membrane protein 1 (CUT1 family) n=1 Tax=Kribbella pratensis TaxID=2512112 RepID=A0A4R8CP78_9ACTN|nr:sugar ABC transporter permease [Kribbella pratensis]TDW77895.1 carbohydrate ABC transporter membrane protein 1 (CUT1 family) [Kribbella pratensis]
MAIHSAVRRAEVPPEVRRNRRRRTLEGWLFALPLVFGIVAFQAAPIVVSMYTSFTRWDGFNSPRLVGGRNYVDLIVNDPIFLQVVRNTIVFTVLGVPATVVLALVLALLGNLKVPGTAFLRMAFFTPYVMNVVAIGFVWYYIFGPTDGLINQFLRNFDIHGPAWLADSSWVIPAVVVVSAWQGVGYPMMILLAGLQGIPEEMYEAARIDGASAWSRLWRITLPLLTPQIFFVTISQFIASFQVFGLIYVLTKGGPGYSSSVYIFYLWQVAFQQGKFGYAAAMAWLIVALIAVLTWVQWKLQKKWVFYD